MKPTKMPFATALAIAACCLLATAPVAAETFEHTYDTGPGGHLEVDTDVGSIEVRTSSSASGVEVRVETSGSNTEKFSVEFDQSGDNPVVRGVYKRSRSLFGGSSPRVRFRITVPERYNVDLQTSGGSIEVDDLEGKVQADTSGGSLSFGNIDGTVRAKTSGGSIELDGSTGDVELRTSGGSLQVGDVNGDLQAHTSGGSITIGRVRGETNAETSGGSIKIRGAAGTLNARSSGGSVTAYLSAQPDGDSRLSTSGGSVTVYLADGISVDIEAKTSGGRIHNDFDLDNEHKSRRSLSGSLNGGGPQLYLSSSGSVSILRK
jgi:DUF4097 and DUF4098 domain-containing protein YvlB